MNSNLYDHESEKTLIGLCMEYESPSAKAAEKLTFADFHSRENAIIYAAINSLFIEGVSIDLMSVVSEIKKTCDLKSIGGLDYLSESLESAVSEESAGRYINIIKDLSTRRKAADVISKAQGVICSRDKSAPEAISAIVGGLEQVTDEQSGIRVVGSKELMLDEMHNMDERRKNGKMQGIPTGFKVLDDNLGGLHNGNIITIAAATRIGKTALATTIGLHAAIVEKKKVMFFCLEMSESEMSQRMIANFGGIDTRRLSSMQLGDSEWPKCANAQAAIGESDIHVCDKSGISIDAICSAARTQQMRKGLDMIVFDYLQIMDVGQGKNELKSAAIGRNTMRLKWLARDLKIPIIVLSQVNRDSNNNKDSRPKLHNLRESGSIEQDSDVVLLLHRPHETDESADPLAAFVEIAKNRKGPCCDVELKWVGSYARFENKRSF